MTDSTHDKERDMQDIHGIGPIADQLDGNPRAATALIYELAKRHRFFLALINDEYVYDHSVDYFPEHITGKPSFQEELLSREDIREFVQGWMLDYGQRALRVSIGDLLDEER